MAAPPRRTTQGGGTQPRRLIKVSRILLLFASAVAFQGLLYHGQKGGQADGRQQRFGGGVRPREAALGRRCGHGRRCCSGGKSVARSRGGERDASAHGEREVVVATTLKRLPAVGSNVCGSASPLRWAPMSRCGIACHRTCHPRARFRCHHVALRASGPVFLLRWAPVPPCDSVLLRIHLMLRPLSILVVNKLLIRYLECDDEVAAY
jgi:hypothetical protein